MNARNIFEQDTLVRCDVCDTPTDERYKIGDRYYCHPDYVLEKEKTVNKLKQKEIDRFKKFVNIV